MVVGVVQERATVEAQRALRRVHGGRAGGVSGAVGAAVGELLVRAAVAEGDTRTTRAVLERALEFDPLAEDLARALMRILIDIGEQAGALAVFERCREAIATALGAQPAPSTIALLARLRPPLPRSDGAPIR